ncbi:hypothetical protein KSP40_PGU019307 [Platanthera guangdongensis]|uniref:Uncharacterized protein n=1 Tax=Platanthera guangdongensis TaxID=2320717 RepID=A0ABR2MI27_9ASPA
MLAAKRCSKDGARNDTAFFTSSGGVRRVCSKEIPSRHLSSSPPSSFKSNSSSISTFSSPSSSSSSPPSHIPLPFPNPPPATPALSQTRSKSLDRTKTSPECADSDWRSVAAARTVLRTTSRSLSVSFQGESFFYQTAKVKPSPLYGPKSSSPREDGISRPGRNIMASYSGGQVGNAPSIISFASEVRRTKKGERRIEDAHMLRLLHNRYLQWRYINSRAESSSSTQLTKTKDSIYNVWITILELHDSAMNKQILLQIFRRNLKLASILKEQIAYLEEWSTLHKDHEISVKGSIEALEASTLRLPVIDGAKVSPLCVKSLLQVEAISSLVSELSKAAKFERSLLNQSRELLSMVAALHVYY